MIPQDLYELDETELLAIVRKELERREISVNLAAPLPDSGFGLAMSAEAMQRLLDLIMPGPLDYADDLLRHIGGRGSDLGVEEEPWQWETNVVQNPDALVSLGAGGLQLRTNVFIPVDDLPEVIRRLRPDIPEASE